MAYTSGRLFAGQTTGISTTAIPLTASAVGDTVGAPHCREVIIQSDDTNTTNVLVGSVLGQFLKITPGQAINVPINNLATIWVKMASGTGIVNWLARD